MIWYNDRRQSLIMRSLYEIDILAEIRSINKKNGRMSEYVYGGLYRDLKKLWYNILLNRWGKKQITH